MLTHIGEGKRLLVVDDEPTIRLFVQQILGEEEGFEVLEAGSVQESLGLLDATKFDMVLVDKNLPDGTGFDVVSSFLEADRDCALIMMTGYASVRSAAEAVRLDFDDYLEKPFGIDELVNSVDRAMKILEMRRANRRLVIELKNKNDQLLAISKVDPLTKLSNHAHFQEVLQQELQRRQREQTSFSVLFIDVDHFKEINDKYGHQLGDRVLKTVASILRGKDHSCFSDFCFRGQDIAARYGGDEFAMILPGADRRNAALKAEVLRNHVDKLNWSSRALPHITLSIGVAAFPQDASDRSELIHAADMALYASKQAGRNRIYSYNESIASLTKEAGGPSAWDLEQLARLDSAIADKDFDFVFQPIVEGGSGMVFGFEALCRPRGFAHPEMLFEAAEKVGRIRDLGRVLRGLVFEASQTLPDGADIFVNLHPQDLFDPKLLKGIPPATDGRGSIVFEVTETQALSDERGAKAILQRLRRQGYRIALDDLGSGYSGLGRLAALEPDFVKLDLNLVQISNTDPRTNRLMRHIVEFANEEGIVTIGEGVETEAQRDALLDMGCPLLQGFLFGKPLPAEHWKGVQLLTHTSLGTLVTISSEKQKYVIFDEKLRTGNATIDAQHSRLFRLILRFQDSLNAGIETQAVAQILDALVNYAGYHFTTEERLMERFGYDEIESHRQEHARFIEKFQDLQVESKKGRVALSHEVAAFLVDWVTDHIASIDLRLGSFLNQRRFSTASG